MNTITCKNCIIKCTAYMYLNNLNLNNEIQKQKLESTAKDCKFYTVKLTGV